MSFRGSFGLYIFSDNIARQVDRQDGSPTSILKHDLTIQNLLLLNWQNQNLYRTV